MYFPVYNILMAIIWVFSKQGQEEISQENI